MPIKRANYRFNQYIKDVKSGKIVTGELIKLAVQRHEEDLKNPDFYFDKTIASKAIQIIEFIRHWKGKGFAGTRIKLEPFQVFYFASIFGWIDKRTGNRRFRQSYLEMARKNGKTSMAAGGGIVHLLLDREIGAQVYFVATKEEQARIGFEDTQKFIKQTPELAPKFHHFAKATTYKMSVIKPLGSNSKAQDGFDPSWGVVDEYHAHQTNEIVDVQKSGMIARKSPLLVYITTAGFDLNSPCFEMYNYTSDILNPDTETENDDIFVAIYELDKDDDVKDERNWAKANPIVATYPEGMQSIRSELKIALDQPEKMRNFLTKNMNVWYEYAENGYMDLSKWNRCETSPSEMEAFMKGANVYLGIDLSMTTDLTAVGWVAVKGGKFMVGQHSFMPDAKYTERMSKDRTRYDVFRDKGYLTLTEGDIVDYFYVKEWVVDFCSKYNVLQIGFDKWNASHFAQDLMNDGYPMLEIPQSITQLSEPTKKFREAVYEGKVLQMGDSMLKWALNNAILKLDQQENVMIGKQVSKDRIDPIAAVINAFSRAMYDDLTVDLNTYIMSDNFSF